MVAANKLILSLMKEGGSTIYQQKKIDRFQEKMKNTVKIKRVGNVDI